MRGLHHEFLITVTRNEGGVITACKEDGLRLFFKTIRDSLQKMYPIQEGDEFDRVLFDDKARRGSNESMTASASAGTRSFDDSTYRSREDARSRRRCRPTCCSNYRGSPSRRRRAA